MNTKKIQSFITKHCEEYPNLTATDMLKAFHQGTFGCGHLITSATFDYLQKEMVCADSTDEMITALPGDFSRVHLSYVKNLKLSIDTFFKIFTMSAESAVQTIEALEEKLDILLQMAANKNTPFELSTLKQEINEWRYNNFPMCRHSDIYRNCYAPTYRVISNKYIPFLKLFASIDNLCQQKKQLVIAIEGGSASGKSTLADILSQIYDCNVFHIDDFFLRPEQRTAERYAEPGGNFDRERFVQEVLNPISNGKNINYRKYDCGKQSILPPVGYSAKTLNIIEGAYSMHPELSGYYDYSVFLDIDKTYQAERIRKRNSEEMQSKFFTIWIPMEEKYFSNFDIAKHCDLIVDIHP